MNVCASRRHAGEPPTKSTCPVHQPVLLLPPRRRRWWTRGLELRLRPPRIGQAVSSSARAVLTKTHKLTRLRSRSRRWDGSSTLRSRLLHPSVQMRFYYAVSSPAARRPTAGLQEQSKRACVCVCVKCIFGQPVCSRRPCSSW